MCSAPPGFAEDVRVTCSDEWLARWHTGQLSLGQAMARGVMTVEGGRADVRVFAGWGGLGGAARA